MRAPHAAGAAGLRFLMPRLSIVIVTYNSRADVDGCLGSLTLPGALAIDHEIIAVDNASTDGTVMHLRERWAGVRVLEAGRNLGFAAANNVGIRQSSGELVLLLNPDTIVTAGAIDRLVAVLDSRADAAVAGPRIVDASGHPELSFGRMISPLAELRQKLLVVGNERGWRTIRSRVEVMTRQRRSVDWVSGACLLIRRQDLTAVGLLDERFFMYTEDVDLCASVRARGAQVLFEPDAEIVHLRGRSVATARKATRVAYRQSQLAFYEKHHPRWAPVLRRYLKLRGAI
jgi:N-acetylglucosaminyl-diphospho-decaprenol L-rhamnosyltransferase